MLRVEVFDSADTLKVKLQGRFTGETAEQTRMITTRCRNGRTLLVDLTDTEFIDAVGEEVLSYFGRFGARFVGITSYTLDICERLNLPVVAGGNSHENTSPTSLIDGQCRPSPEPEKKNSE